LADPARVLRALPFVLALLVAPPRPAAPPRVGETDTLELVESFPTETALDQPDLREAHVVWPELIGEARGRLDMAWFYVSDAEGSRLAPTLAAVRAAAARGVRVRVLADACFHETYPQTLDALAAVEGIEVRLLDLRGRTGGVLHAKYFLIDERTLWLGSQNCDWRSLEHIQELGVVVRSAAVQGAFRDVFEADWSLAAGEIEAVSEVDRLVDFTDCTFGGETVRVLPVASPGGWLPSQTTWDLPRIVELIEGASKTVRVQLLTYRASDRDGARWDVLEQALLAAAKRGVHVELLLADWCERPGTIEGLQALVRAENVAVRLVTVPEHSSGFVPYARVVHAKYLVCDGASSWLGTDNWERDAFHRSRNLGLIVEGRAFGARLDRYFESGWNSAYAEDLDPERSYAPPRIGR